MTRMFHLARAPNDSIPLSADVASRWGLFLGARVVNAEDEGRKASVAFPALVQCYG